MAIDSSLFVADIPAGTYAAGDRVNLGCIAGPSVVRSGRGAALLKNIMSGGMIGGVPYWSIHVKNSDWIDDMQNIAANMSNTGTGFSKDSGSSQYGHNDNLTPNSSWEVWAECLIGGTSTAANTLFALVDVDYPSVSSIIEPSQLVGTPTSIPFSVTVTTEAIGAASTAKWTDTNVDIFKAGYEYALEKVEAVGTGSTFGFVAFNNAAGMGGLQRIVIINGVLGSLRYPVQFASKLVKGPMDIRVMLFQTASSSMTLTLVNDYVKRRIA